MDIGVPLIDYGPVPVDDLIEKMVALPPAFWASDRASRARLAGGRKGDAVFFFNDAPGFVRRGTLEQAGTGTVNVFRSAERALFADIIALIGRHIAPHFPSCAPMRVQLAELPAGEVIKPHVDSAILTRVHRLHVPLTTNPKVTFFVQGNPFRLEPGRLYELNNTVGHWVSNEGDATRVHLLVDLLPATVARVVYHDTRAGMVAATS